MVTSVPTTNAPTTVAQCECETPESIHSTTTDAEDDSETSTATVIGAALGGVAAGLLLSLVGVVMGWACICYRNKHKLQSQQR